MLSSLEKLSRQIAPLAKASGLRIVLAESCTAGLVAQSLTRVPGASQWFCGSAVVYRNTTKTAWLGVPDSLLENPDIGPVSEEVAAAMCQGALAQTPEADWAFSVTGHLGPDAPADLDGLIYIGKSHASLDAAVQVLSRQLARCLPEGTPFASLREYRQTQAAQEVLEAILLTLREIMQDPEQKSKK